MLQELATTEEHTYEWIDLTAPDATEVHELATRYGLHEASVKDVLEHDHLPKYERMKNYSFTVLRIYDASNDLEADTVQELTNKVAVFIADSFIITIHLKPWDGLKRISEEKVNTGICQNPVHILLEIVKAGLYSFDAPGRKLNAAIDSYEEQVFLKQHKKPVLKGLYFLKRKIDVIRRVLLLTFEIVDKLDPADQTNAYSRDVRDLYVKQQSIYDSLSENTNHLLNIYFNISSQRTNETIRVLTIFSVFFMPLTFVVGIYGMNFKFMPELNWHMGYPSVLILMAAIVITIYIWFKRKGWL